MMTAETYAPARRAIAAARAERTRPTIDPKTVRDAEALADHWRRFGFPFPRNASALAAGLAWCAITAAGGRAIDERRTGARLVGDYISEAARHPAPVRLWRIAWTAAGRTCRRYANEPAGLNRNTPPAELTREAVRLADALYQLATR